MKWTETAGTHRAEGIYDRVYTITFNGVRFVVAETDYIKGRTCATLEDAKSYCRQVERSLAAG